MLSADGRQMHMGAHLGPPLPQNSNVIQGRGFPGTGWNGIIYRLILENRGSSLSKLIL